MEKVAQVLQLPVPTVGYRRNPNLHSRVEGNGRDIAVAKFRELADKLESGELDCARCQWSDTHGLLVEVDGVQYDLTKGDAPAGAQRPISGMETVTRTAWREDGSGTVQYTATTIEEVGG